MRINLLLLLYGETETSQTHTPKKAMIILLFGYLSNSFLETWTFWRQQPFLYKRNLLRHVANTYENERDIYHTWLCMKRRQYTQFRKFWTSFLKTWMKLARSKSRCLVLSNNFSTRFNIFKSCDCSCSGSFYCFFRVEAGQEQKEDLKMTNEILPKRRTLGVSGIFLRRKICRRSWMSLRAAYLFYTLMIPSASTDHYG